MNVRNPTVERLMHPVLWYLAGGMMGSWLVVDTSGAYPLRIYLLFYAVIGTTFYILDKTISAMSEKADKEDSR